MTVSEQIGDNARKVRRRALMSQEALARRAALHRTEIGELERGLRIPRLDTAIKILDCTAVDPRDLFRGIVWRGPDRFDEDGWFTISGLDEPVDLRLPRRRRAGRLRRRSRLGP